MSWKKSVDIFFKKTKTKETKTQIIDIFINVSMYNA